MAIRDFGGVNMLSLHEVQREAYERGFYELVIFIEENRNAYVRFILHGDSNTEN
jgi:hypothetical protein